MSVQSSNAISRSGPHTPPLRLGWFSSGRDQAAIDLLAVACENIASGFIPAEIKYVFCNRAEGESEATDRFLAFARGLGIETVTFSSRDFMPELKRQSLERWRGLYHEKAANQVARLGSDLIMLAGYMLIVSPEMCGRFKIINLHPAAPGGPAGTWQEVIWQLIGQKGTETGGMMHMVTEVLDEGPPITYCTFPIRGERFDRRWQGLGDHLGNRPQPSRTRTTNTDTTSLFNLIRDEGVRRELPLIVLTLKTIAEDPSLIDKPGASEACCLNREIESYLRRSTRP